MHEVMVNRFGGLSLPRKSVVRLTDRPAMTLDVYRGRKKQQQQQKYLRKNYRTDKNTIFFHMNFRWHLNYNSRGG